MPPQNLIRAISLVVLNRMAIACLYMAMPTNAALPLARSEPRTHTALLSDTVACEMLKPSIGNFTMDPGRTSVDRDIRKLMQQMNAANPLWGAPRIHGELLKLGIEISQATVAKYLVRRRGTPSPTWRSFLRNQAAGITAIDMFVVVSASFRLLYVMVILAHDRRKIVRFDVTRHPTAGWLARQVTEAFRRDTAPRYLLRDRDASYGSEFCKRVDAMGITEVVTAPRSPWRNAYVERVIGSIRCDCLDYIVIFNERHLRRVMSSYAD